MTHQDVYPKHWVLWDGDCGLCQEIAGWIKARDHQQNFEVVSYQQAPNPPMTNDIYSACSKSVHVVTRQGIVFKAGSACLFILEQIGYKTLAQIGRTYPLIWLIEWGYWLVARNRRWIGRLLFRAPSCKI